MNKVRLSTYALMWFLVAAPAAGQSVTQLATKPEASKSEESKPADGAVKLTEKSTAVNLAVPAGLTASMSDSTKADAVPRIGFQAWKPDDFFAGAFFTLGTAPTLTGDVRKAGQFVRDPPNTGTSFLVSGNRMFLKYRCGRIVKIRPARQKDKTPERLEELAAMDPAVRAAAEALDEKARLTHELLTDPCYLQPGDKQDAVIIGLSARVGASTTTLEHTPRTPDGEELAERENREASIYYGTLSLLLTSRTFRTDNGDFQFGLEAGKTWRKVGGDAAAHLEFLAQPDVFGHPRTNLSGSEITFFARLTGFQPFVRITRISRAGGADVAGLTGTQATFGINVSSALFQAAQEK